MAEAPAERHIFISYRRQEPDKGFALRLADDLRVGGPPCFKTHATIAKRGISS